MASPAMDARLHLAQLVVGSALAGLCWTVQLAVYPHFSRIIAVAGADAFRAYHAAYTRSMGFVAAPLMLAELFLATAWIVSAPAASASLVGGALVVALWALTFACFVPGHTRLQAAPDGASADRLASFNWTRTALWTARVALLAAVA